MAKTVKLPPLLDILAGFGVSAEEAIRRLEILKGRFPAGDVPLTLVEGIVSGYLDAGVQAAIKAAIVSDFMQLVKTLKGPVKRDDSALA